MSGGDAQTQLQGHFLPSAKPAHDLSKKRICLRHAAAPSKPRARLLLHRESIGPQKRNHPESCRAAVNSLPPRRVRAEAAFGQMI